MSTEPAKVFVHSMISTHLKYYLTSWPKANQSTLKPLETPNKQALKILDKKIKSLQITAQFKKKKIQQILSWDDLIKYANMCLIYKVTHGLGP